jgi:hypothetical protein
VTSCGMFWQPSRSDRYNKCVLEPGMVQSGGIFYRIDEANQTTSIAACADRGRLPRNHLVADGVICPVIRVESNAFAQCLRSRILCVPANITILGSRSFHFCDHVSCIAFEALSRLRQIETDVFSDCNSLRAICLPASVEFIGESCFTSLSGIELITFESGIRLSRLPEGVFKDCRFQVISIPSSIEEIGNLCFRGCYSLTTVAFEPGSQLRRIGRSAFSRCPSLTSICFPSALETINGEVIDKSGLHEAHFEPSDMKFCVSGDFIMNWDRTIGILYLGHSAEITIPSRIEVIGISCFENREFISRLLFEKPCRVHRIEKGAFLGCLELASILIPASIERLCSYSFCACSKLTRVDFESGSRLRRIEKCAFVATPLKSISIPPLVEFIDGSAFSWSNITSATIVLDNSQFTIWDDFLADGSGTSLISYLDHSSQAESRHGHFDIYSGRSAKISQTSFVTYWAHPSGARCVSNCCIPSRFVTISKRCFMQCSSVESVTFDSGCSIVLLEKELFAFCGLRSIVVPKSVEVLGKQCFDFCGRLTSVLFENGSRLRRIETECFRCCASLERVSIPASVEILCSRCFHCCTSLVSIVSETGSTPRSIESEVFACCTSLSFIEIPNCIELLSPSWHSESSIRVVRFDGLTCLRRMIEACSVPMNGSIQIEVQMKEDQDEPDSTFLDDRIKIIRQL